MKVYQFLSGIGFLKNYHTKFMFIAFLGIHIPLLGIIVLLILSSGSAVDKTSFFLLTLALTLLATAVTLYILNALTLPLRKTQLSLQEYINNHAMPHLPEGFNDELGLLMRDINRLALARKGSGNEKEQTALVLAQLQETSVALAAQIKLLKTDADEPEKYTRLTNEVNRQQQQIQHWLDKINTGTVR